MTLRYSAALFATTFLVGVPCIAQAASPLMITTASCPNGVQGQGYTGCVIGVTGGVWPYTFAVDPNFATLPEGLTLNSGSGVITGSQIGGQGTYQPNIIVTDHAGARTAQQVTFAINGANGFLASIFTSNSIFHHRMDAATTGLPVDTSPAAPILSAYLPAPIRAAFGGAAYASVPNGIPVFSVPQNQQQVAVKTTTYQSYFISAPIPWNAPVQGTANSTGDRHVLIYVQGGGNQSPALYEMWVGQYQGGSLGAGNRNGPWTDGSNALWPNVNSDALTPQGKGTSDAAGLPYAPLLVNADEVIGNGTPGAPRGAIQHTIPFTVNYMLNYWVWPATQSAGAGSCTDKSGNVIPPESQISQSAPPASCNWSGPAGQIYRLKASVPTPACAATSPQAAVIIQALRNYGIIMIDNGGSGGNGFLAGTPDARWNDADLRCLVNLNLAAFEPVNVSSLMVSNNSGATRSTVTARLTGTATAAVGATRSTTSAAR